VKTETGDDASTATWEQVQPVYRCWLYEEGAAILDDDGKVIKRGFAAGPQTWLSTASKER